MKQQIKRFLKEQNSGAAIVIVIVAMAFVGIFASTLMSMSLVNFRMKTTEREVKESFYSAETVFEQMLVGLQNLCSDSAEQSYAFIMQNYANFPEEKRQAEFQKEFLKAVTARLCVSATNTTHYDLTKLMQYVDANIEVGIVTPTTSKSWIGARTEDSTKLGTPDEFKEVNGSLFYPANGDYLMLKGLHLEFTDGAGYLTVIDTDIMVKTPKVKFAQSNMLDNVFSYSVIADNSLRNLQDSGQTVVDGNLYVGEGGIFANHNLVLKNAEYIVTKGGVEVHQNGALNVYNDNGTPNFWAKSITVDRDVKTVPCNVTLRAHSYIQDDLTINGNNVKVALEDSYYGYGNGTAIGVAPTTAAQNSSAMIVNGINNTLDFSKVKHLILAGNAYINIGQAKASSTDATNIPKQIPMGESIAIKGSQVAYLVPDECIGVLDGQSLYGKNPMTGAEYARLEEIKVSAAESGSNYKELDVNRSVLGGSSLASYGISGATGMEKVFVPSNGDTLVYYYLKFPSTKDAERYFKDYYDVNQEKLNRYLGIYTAGGIQSNTGFTRLTMAGDYFTATQKDAAGNVVALNPSTGDNPETLERELVTYRNTYHGLTTALVTNYMSLTSAEEARGEVFENVVKKDELKAYVGDGNTKTFTTSDGTNCKAILTCAPTYTYDGDTNVKLIIATGDVEIASAFKGVIITDGSVILKAGGNIQSAKNASMMSDITRALQAESSSLTDSKRPVNFIRNAENFKIGETVISGDTTQENAKIDFADIVAYQNWVKH